MKPRRRTPRVNRIGSVAGLPTKEKGNAVRLSKKMNALLVRGKLDQGQVRLLQAYIQLFKLRRKRTPRNAELAFAFPEISKLFE